MPVRDLLPLPRWLPLPAVLLAVGMGINAAATGSHGAIGLDRFVDVAQLALVLVLFEGGFSGGWRRMRPSLAPVLVLGLVGTLLTTALLAVLAHVVLRLSVDVSLLLAVALGPTDPAAVFSVLGNHDVRGRSGVILEGESGANDPVGIAVMVAALAYVQGDGSVSHGAVTVLLELAVGSAVGAAAGLVASLLLSWARTSFHALVPLGAVAAAFGTYYLADALHGSGFLAVLVAGLVMGDRIADHAPTAWVVALVAALAEVATFGLLGLAVDLGDVADALWLGLAAFALLAVVVRPVVVLPLLAPADLSPSERGFVAWAGLKGAVPALLGALVVLEGVPGADRTFAIVFVATAASIVVQGGSIPWLVHRLGLVDRRSASGARGPN
ncbi:MAG: sodium:proton exchanger [Thermoleophilia bacterium]|nr:sodium:proton exchanger [Thermoleophilia bacterium]